MTIDNDNDKDLDLEAWCCYLRLAPPRLSIDTHFTYRQIMDAIRIQQWFPDYCYYCYSCPLDIDSYEKHIVVHHPGKMAYPGPAPQITTKVLEIIESDERDKMNGIRMWRRTDKK